MSRRVPADLETPLSAYLKLAAGPYSFLLESVEGGEKWGRYSIIGLPARTILTVRGHRYVVSRDGEEVETGDAVDPLAFVAEFHARYQVTLSENIAGFQGGLVGYFAYDCVRYVEPRLADCQHPDRLNVPDIVLMVAEGMLVFDNLRGTLDLIILADPAQPGALESAQAQLDSLEARLAQPFKLLPPLQLSLSEENAVEFRSEAGQAWYEQSVQRIRDYILAGDVMQVVPSHRLAAPFAGHPVNLYRALRHLNPSPYLYFLDLDDFQVAGSSPEILVRVNAGEVTVRPIAGTRHRGRDEAEDQALERELLADPKELAEHLMLIDLGRNDVGRVAETGTVRVTDQMVIERYSHVMHIVSNVTGQLKAGLSGVEMSCAQHCPPAPCPERQRSAPWKLSTNSKLRGGVSTGGRSATSVGTVTWTWQSRFAPR